MATETVSENGYNLTYDQWNEAHECIQKARGVVEMMGPYAINVLGYETAQAIIGSAWAVTQQLDKLAEITRLDPKAEA